MGFDPLARRAQLANHAAQFLATTCLNGRTRPIPCRHELHEIWNLQTGLRNGYINGPLALKDPALSPDGQFLCGRTSGGAADAINFEVWSFHSHRRVQMLADPPMTQSAPAIPIGFVEPGQILALDDGLCVWDIQSGGVTQRISFDAKRGPDELWAVSANGKLVAVLDSKQTLSLLDSVRGRVLGKTPIPGAADTSHPLHGSGLAFSPDGKELALLLERLDRRIIVWSVEQGTILADFSLSARPEFPLSRRAAAFSWLPGGDGWLVGGDQIVDRLSGVVLFEVPRHQDPMAEECAARKVLDASHILLSFKALNQGIGLETFPLPAEAIAKARAMARSAGN